MPSLIEPASIVYLEGYLFDRAEAKEAFKAAARLAAQVRRQGGPHSVGCLLRRPPPRRFPQA